jgi:hypothetical protein
MANIHNPKVLLQFPQALRALDRQRDYFET